MHWLTHALSVTAVACITLGLVHLFVWIKQPARRVHLVFFILAVSVAALTPFEWVMVRAQTTTQYGFAVRWLHVPVTLIVISLVWFISLYFGTGRRWLALSTCGLRVVFLALNFWFTPNINYRQIVALKQVALPAGEHATAAIGIVNPWTLLGQLVSLSLLIYVIDAALNLWRRGDPAARRRAIVIGGATAFFIVEAVTYTALALFGVIVAPHFISFPFLAIILAMAFELSQDVVRAAQLSNEIKSNEERLSLAQEAGEIGTFDWDLRTGKMIWNEKLEAVYGLPPGKFSGRLKDWREYVHPEDVGRCETEIGAAIRQKSLSWESEYRIFRVDTHEQRWLYAKARLGFDESGEVIRMLGVNIDITDRKLKDAALQESEKKLSGIVTSAMDAMVSIDESQSITLFNPAAERMFGYTAAEVMGQPVDKLIPERFRGVHKDYVRAFGASRITKRRVGRLEPIDGRRSDGTEFPIEASISQVELNGTQTYTVIMRDVTERVQAEEALRASEEQFRNLADTAPVLIWMSGPNKLCTYVNKGWLDFTGRTMEEEKGDGWAESVHPDDRARCLETFNYAFEHLEKFKIEYRLRRADGEYRWVLDCGTPRLSHDGKFIGFIGSCIDITDRKQAEESFHKAHAELNELKNQLQAENIILQEEIKLAHRANEMIGDSKALQYVLFKIEQVAHTDSSVLILGETGTGKELVARAIHEQSRRKERPLIKVNCAALSPTLIESELFGHEKGSFTGAASRKIGRFELANGGTLFLDEIGDLPLELQSKLLRVLQEGEFERLGSSRTIKVNVRIIAATNRNMKAAIEKGTFREDLWYRLNVFPITVPPLRQRKEDIPLLVDHLVKMFSSSFGKPITSISAATMKRLCEYSWPGNIRELGNVLERAVINAQGPVLHLVEQLEKPIAADPFVATKTLEEIEKEYITRVLAESSWRIEGPNGAARILGLNPSTLRTRMAKLGVHRDNHSMNSRKANASG